jgi:hypothetical protein
MFKPFLLDLLRATLPKRTFNRHRDKLWLVGGEMIRRQRDDPDLKRLSVDKYVGHLLDEDSGPLIWPRIPEAEQTGIDATCRKLDQFLRPSTSVEQTKFAHKLR